MIEMMSAAAAASRLVMYLKMLKFNQVNSGFCILRVALNIPNLITKNKLAQTAKAKSQKLPTNTDLVTSTFKSRQHNIY